jgi:hypothetical protein
MVQFNFGPIARTEAGGTKNTINLASFPLHVMLNALVGSTSVEEFIAWLWHDLYKPAFHWVRNSKGTLSWYHVPGMGAFSQAEKKFAQHTNIREGLVRTHHGFKNQIPHFVFRENDFISDQGDQVNLGDAVNYIQLSLAAEPALPTQLARAVIADAFIEIVTKNVAGALQKAFIADGRTPIERVRFEFETTSNIVFSPQRTNTEIWNKVGKHFDIRMDGNTFIMRHLTPVSNSKHEPFATVFTADLTGTPLLPDEMLDNTVSLAELLVLYQDTRTVIIAVPQSQLYTIDLSQIREATLDTSRHRLEQDFNVLTKKDSVDYLKAAFDSQIEICEVPGRLPKGGHSRLLNDAVQRPVELLTEARNSSEGRLCCLTGTWFKTDLPADSLSSNDLFKRDFVDTEFVGLVEDVTQQRYLAPLTYLYVINSSGAGRGEETRKALRGAFAYFAPASHFAIDEQGAQAVEQPLLDRGNRFTSQLNRVTVTTQEFTLFQQISRRIIAKLWERITKSKPLPLPYLGAIALTQEPEQRAHIAQLLPQLNLLFSEVSLRTYPFELGARPAIEIGLETSVYDKKLHHTRHTLLKTTPHIITIDPQSTIPILIDDNVQVNLTQAFFKRLDLFTAFTNELKNRKKKVNQKDLWLKLVLASNDPVTAVFESAVATINTRYLPKTLSLETAAFNAAERFWEEHVDIGDFAENWEQYEQLSQKATNTLEEFPALLLLLQTLQKKDEN